MNTGGLHATQTHWYQESPPLAIFKHRYQIKSEGRKSFPKKRTNRLTITEFTRVALLTVPLQPVVGCVL